MWPMGHRLPLTEGTGSGKKAAVRAREEHFQLNVYIYNIYPVYIYIYQHQDLTASSPNLYEVQSTEQRRAAIGATLAEYAEDAPGRVREATQRGVGLGALAFPTLVRSWLGVICRFCNQKTSREFVVKIRATSTNHWMTT